MSSVEVKFVERIGIEVNTDGKRRRVNCVLFYTAHEYRTSQTYAVYGLRDELARHPLRKTWLSGKMVGLLDGRASERVSAPLSGNVLRLASSEPRVKIERWTGS